MIDPEYVFRFCFVFYSSSCTNCSFSSLFFQKKKRSYNPRDMWFIISVSWSVHISVYYCIYENKENRLLWIIVTMKRCVDDDTNAVHQSEFWHLLMYSDVIEVSSIPKFLIHLFILFQIIHSVYTFLLLLLLLLFFHFVFNFSC